jgi:tetratricopeptide (TPR) repeat protein
MKKIFLYLLAFTAAIAVGCKNKRELLKEADKYADDSDYSKAIHICNEVLKQDSTSIDAYNIKATCFEKLKDDDDALDNYSAAIRFDKHPYEAYRKRANILCRQELYEKGLPDFQGALDNAPTPSARAATFIERAYVYMRLHKFENARNDATEALKYNPHNASAMCLVGESFLSDSGKVSDAIPWFEKAIELDSNWTTSYEDLAFAYTKTGEYKKAIAVCSKILSKYPDRAYAYNTRGYLKMLLNDFDGAMADINRCIQMEPGNPASFRNRGLLYLRLKKNNEACADFQNALDLHFTRYYGNEVEELVKKYCTK